MTADKVDYSTYQEAAGRFPEVPADEFNRSLVLIESNGTAFFAAEAVYRSLAYRRSREWLAWSYDHVPGFAVVSETGYDFIARRRRFCIDGYAIVLGQRRAAANLCLGSALVPACTRRDLFSRVPIAVDADGRTCRQRRRVAGESVFAGSSWPSRARRLRLLPTLCWFNSSDAFLHFLCGSGVLCSLFLIFGIAPAVSLVALFVLVLVAHNCRTGLFQFSMGRAFAGDWVFIDLFCTVAAVATGVAIVATIISG